MIKWFKKKPKDASSKKVNEQDPTVLSPDEGIQEQLEPPSIETPKEIADTSADLAAEEKSAQQEVIESQEPDSASDRPASKGRFFKHLRERLRKTREQLSHRVDRVVLGKKTIDDDLLEELEEVLITSDLGVKTTLSLLERVAEKVRKKELTDPAKLHRQLRDEICSILEVPAPVLDFRSRKPFVVMVVGVNGVGKTTTIGKLAHILKQDGLSVMLVAADTFRAAAIEQLQLWANRVDVPMIRQQSGSDPSAVVFDAIDAAISRKMDVVIIDTAGRMHTKVNLMEELKKVKRVIEKKIPGAPHEILLVLDATTGQNALSQASMFQESLGVSGLILTKLDGTAKGGIVVAICDELEIPVRFIGIGEGMEDLRPFDPNLFADALF